MILMPQHVGVDYTRTRTCTMTNIENTDDVFINLTDGLQVSNFKLQVSRISEKGICRIFMNYEQFSCMQICHRWKKRRWCRIAMSMCICNLCLEIRLME